MNTVFISRYFHDERPTLGIVRVAPVDTLGSWSPSGPTCFSLEDRYRAGPKVAGDTRIPDGDYPLRWRTAGRWAERYQAMGFPGSLEICDVPGFSAVLIHAGNTKRDTAGCLLLGLVGLMERRQIQRSRDACKLLYTDVAAYQGDWQISIH